MGAQALEEAGQVKIPNSVEGLDGDVRPWWENLSGAVSTAPALLLTCLLGGVSLLGLAVLAWKWPVVAGLTFLVGTAIAGVRLRPRIALKWVSRWKKGRATVRR